MRVAAAWWAALLVLFVVAPASAESLHPLSVCVSASPASASALFDAPQHFDCRSDQSTLGGGTFWVRPTAIPEGAGTTLTRVRSGSQWMNELSLYARYADGRIIVQHLDAHAISEHLQLGSNIEFTLPTRGQPVTGLLWRVEHSGNFRRILGDAALASPLASAHETLVTGILYAGFAGLCLALIVYNLALWAALRRRFQLAYCAMVAAIGTYATSSSGAILTLVPWLTNNQRIELVYLMLPVIMATSLWFAQTFFQPRGLPKALDRLLTGTVAWLMVTSLTFAALAPVQMKLLDKLIGLGFAATLLLTIPMLVAAWRRGLPFLLIFALAWAAPAMMAWMRTANTFHLTRQGFSLQYSTIAVMAVEALLSSVAIAYRIHLIARERDEARMQEIAARMLADTDPLTGLLNRRALLRGAIGRGGDQVLLLADIDHFKSVNDTIGHDGGDEVLRVFSRALRTAAPDDALVARIGGEEFAILAPVEAGLSAASVLERLREQRMPYDLSVTASIGTCSGPLASEIDWKALYRCADRALFDAKAAGRDRARDAGALLAA